MTGADHNPWKARVIALGRSSYDGPCDRVIRLLAEADRSVAILQNFSARGTQYAELRRLRAEHLVPYAQGPCEIPGCTNVTPFAAKCVMETFVYDHCHLHGEVRGVLCQDCNYAMSFIDRGRPWRPELQDAYESYWTRCSECAPFGPWHPWEGVGPTGLVYELTPADSHQAEI
ncbi:MAG: endonuclease domain-containing protein [Streptosporangiaceae bacterium]